MKFIAKNSALRVAAGILSLQDKPSPSGATLNFLRVSRFVRFGMNWSKNGDYCATGVQFVPQLKFQTKINYLSMTKEQAIQLFEQKQVRSVWDSEQEKWYFSIVDVVGILTASVDTQAYWRKLKQRLKEEGNETVTNCHALKMQAVDGKMRLTDVADTEQLFRLIQSIPSPKAGAV